MIKINTSFKLNTCKLNKCLIHKKGGGGESGGGVLLLLLLAHQKVQLTLMKIV